MNVPGSTSASGKIFDVQSYAWTPTLLSMSLAPAAGSAGAFNRYAGKMVISSNHLWQVVRRVEKSARPAVNARVVEGFVSPIGHSRLQRQAASHYGNIRAALERQERLLA
ncbi:hypothetical protein M8494_06535 [Serratia ureilytica]